MPEQNFAAGDILSCNPNQKDHGCSQNDLASSQNGRGMSTLTLAFQQKLVGSQRF